MVDSKDPMQLRKRNMPLEMIEEILSFLPVKSLGRFSTVSKPWKAIICDEKFIRKHKRRASLPGRERILFSHSPVMPATTRLLSNRLDDVDQLFTWPLIKDARFLASCSDMWCVSSGSSIFVLNPSMGTYKKLPPPLCNPSSWSREISFGMGFDSVSDDYKILIAPTSHHAYRIGYELYSLRSDSWRKIPPLRTPIVRSFSYDHHHRHYPHTNDYDVVVGDAMWKMDHYPRSNGVFLGNALHWVTDDAVISFDLSTEKCAEFVQTPFEDGDEADLTVLRGKLCLYNNLHLANRFLLWEMQEYGDGNSWTNIMDIDMWSLVGIPSTKTTIIIPLYLYQNGSILMKAATSETATVFMVNEGKLQNIVWRGSDCGATTGRLYVESFVSPATYGIESADSIPT